MFHFLYLFIAEWDGSPSFHVGIVVVLEVFLVDIIGDVNNLEIIGVILNCVSFEFLKVGVEKSAWGSPVSSEVDTDGVAF